MSTSSGEHKALQGTDSDPKRNLKKPKERRNNDNTTSIYTLYMYIYNLMRAEHTGRKNQSNNKKQEVE